MARVILVPTPVGNLGDITVRAREVLESADVIAAEDTRHSGRLLDLLGIRAAGRLQRLDAHTMAARAPALLESAEVLAYVSDAGTPGISDPGADLLRLALDHGHEVEVLPGATAFVPALILSGLPVARFTFEGFLPRRGSARNARLAAIAASTATSIIYEGPSRISSTLQDLATACGADRQASVTRELSKRFEQTHRGTLGELALLPEAELRGEIVVVVGPAAEEAEDRDFLELAAFLAASGLDRRQLKEALSLAGAPRNVAYQLSLQAEGGQDG